MDNLDIEYFIEVANKLSFTKASEALFVSQSTISKKILSLEKELGFKLLIRSSKKVELTSNGKSFKRLFEKMIKDFNKELAMAKMRISMEAQAIRIGVIEGWNINSYVPLFNNCSFKTHSIEFEKINSLLKKLKKKEYDVIIGSQKGILQAIEEENIDNIIVKPLKQIKRIIYLSVNNPLSKKDNLSIKDLSDQTFFIGKSNVARQNAQDIIDNEGIKVKYSPKLNHDTVALELSLGSGFALGDDFSKEKTDNDFKYFYIDYYQEVAMCYMDENLDSNKELYLTEIENIFKSK